jgi:CBS-domain-containing membrane protein
MSGAPLVVNRRVANAVGVPGLVVVLPLLQSASARQAAMSGKVIRRSDFRFMCAPFAERSLVQSGLPCALQFVTRGLLSLDGAWDRKVSGALTQLELAERL